MTSIKDALAWLARYYPATTVYTAIVCTIILILLVTGAAT